MTPDVRRVVTLGGNTGALAEVAGRRGSPPGAGAESVAEAPVTRSGKGALGPPPLWVGGLAQCARSPGGQSGPHTRAAEEPRWGPTPEGIQRGAESRRAEPEGRASGVTAAAEPQWG